MNILNYPEYDIQHPTGHCTITGKPLQPGEPYVAALIEADPSPTPSQTDQGATAAAGTQAQVWLQRADISLDAWGNGHRPERVFSHWRSIVPQPHEKKKKLFVDDSVLLDLLRRLADAVEPDRLAFRFVLGLILLRKKRLQYEGTENRPDPTGQTREWWRLTPKGSAAPTGEVIDLLNPQMSDEQVRQVTEQLTQILETNL